MPILVLGKTLSDTCFPETNGRLLLVDMASGQIIERTMPNRNNTFERPLSVAVHGTMFAWGEPITPHGWLTTITITSWDRKAEKIAGSFSGKIASVPPNDSITVTNGVFDTKYKTFP